MCNIKNLHSFITETAKPMPKRYCVLFSVFCMCMIACNRWHTADLPKVVSLSKLRQTSFVPTLENEIAADKNVIYAPSFLFAWDKLKQLLNAPITILGSNSGELGLVNQSASYKKSLNDNEYELKATVDNGEIVAEAFFNKALPFSKTLQKVNSGILFDGARVKAFGMNTLDYEIEDFTQILFYKDDDNFILQLTPGDTSNQIIFVKGLQNIKTLAQAIKQTNILTQQGGLQRHSNNELWKYRFYETDSFVIPVIRFNIETNYKGLEGMTFAAGDKKQTIKTAYQRTAFSLDENGAIIESAALVAAADSVAAPLHPKKLIFDKPFFIIIKHTAQANPYFVMKVENGELMERK